MSRTAGRRAVLIGLPIGFVLIHVFVAWLGWVLPNQPMGDVVLVYEPWSRGAVAGSPIVGIDQAWVYPQLAMIPILVALGISTVIEPLVGAQACYLIAWALLVTVLDVIAFTILLGRGRARSRTTAAAFWCVALLALGPIALYRLDAITVPLVVVGGLLLVRHPAIAAVLLTIGAWIKIWPGALVAASVVLLRRRMSHLVAAVATTALVVSAVVLLGGRTHLLGFLTEQTDRGLQIEAVAATPFLWSAFAGGAQIAYSQQILTFQIEAPGADAVSAVLTPLLMLAFVGLLALAAWRVQRGASALRLLPPLVLALVTSLIVFNKVGSPQFQVWLIAPIIVWIVWDRHRAAVPALLVLALCALTFVVYPVFYDAVLNAQAQAVLVLTVRNAVLVALLVVCVRAMWRVPAVRVSLES